MGRCPTARLPGSGEAHRREEQLYAGYLRLTVRKRVHLEHRAAGETMGDRREAIWNGVRRVCRPRSVQSIANTSGSKGHRSDLRSAAGILDVAAHFQRQSGAIICGPVEVGCEKSSSAAVAYWETAVRARIIPVDAHKNLTARQRSWRVHRNVDREMHDCVQRSIVLLKREEPCSVGVA